MRYIGLVDCPSANDLAALLDGTIAAGRRIVVERHLDTCLACTELVAELARSLAPGMTARAWATTHSRAEIIAMWRRVIAKLSVPHGALSPDTVSVTDDDIAIASARPGPSPYTAVEQLHGAPPSTAGDQFAVCASLWEALAGTPPFAGTTPGALAVVMMTPPEPPDRDPIYAVLGRGLAADPAARWPDPGALARALERPPRQTARFRWLIGVAIVIAAIGATWLVGFR
jgi:anti-sigma factor RsiW